MKGSPKGPLTRHSDSWWHPRSVNRDWSRWWESHCEIRICVTFYPTVQKWRPEPIQVTACLFGHPTQHTGLKGIVWILESKLMSGWEEESPQSKQFPPCLAASFSEPVQVKYVFKLGKWIRKPQSFLPIQCPWAGTWHSSTQLDLKHIGSSLLSSFTSLYH